MAVVWQATLEASIAQRKVSMRKNTLVFANLIASILLAWASGRSAQAQLDPRIGSCRALTGQEIEFDEFEPSPEVKELVDDIITNWGLGIKDFDLKAASVPNAAAVICDGKRKLLYSPTYFINTANAAGSEWPVKAILAHEVGHHLRGHTLSTGVRRAVELEADDFSGFVLCTLGATLRDAQQGIAWGAQSPDPSYPEPQERRDSVAQGWERALQQGKCPKEVKSILPSYNLTDRRDTVEITAENVAEIASKGEIVADQVVFHNVKVEATKPLTILANRITFDNRSVLHGRKIALIAKEIQGGTVSSDGGPGEGGGEILVAAYAITGTTLTARGGDGRNGKAGDDGRDGSPGHNGTNGKCGAGMFGDFRGSTDGSAGAPGTDGGDGDPGGDGGDGGVVELLTFRQSAVFLDVKEGLGGTGGPGGRGGRGGPGGRGGSGCSGIGGSQPSRPDGADGLDGRQGRPGGPGRRGKEGRIRQQALIGSAELAELARIGNLAEIIKAIEERINHK